MEERTGFHKQLAQDMWAGQEGGERKTGCAPGCALGRVHELGLAEEELLRVGV